MINKGNFSIKACSVFSRKYYLTAFLIIQLSINSFSQESDSYTAARSSLVEILKRKDFDNAWAQSIDQFYFKTCDSLIDNKVMIEERPIKEVLTKLFVACESRIKNRTISILRIPSVNSYFLQTLEHYPKLPLENLYRQISITQSPILAAAFDGSVLGDSIAIIVGIREMLNNPYFISTRLKEPQYQPFKDTLLYYLANGAPEILKEKLLNKDTLFTSLVTQSNNRTVKAVAQVEKDIYYNNVLPFGLAIGENLITADSIKKLRLVPSAYYKAFVDETIRLYTSKDREIKTYLERPIIDINKAFANKFYISEINHLHDLPDKERFQILNNLSSRELYFLLIGGSGELYTSSFLYVYKKFIKETEKEGLDNFLSQIDYYQFDKFLTNVSIYGLVNDLVENLQYEKFAGLMVNSFRKVLSSQLTDDQIILNAMTLSEILHALRKQPVVQHILLTQIGNYEKLKVKEDIMLQRIFAGFKNILQNKTDYTSDATYDILPVTKLKKNNTIVQAAFFYDDEDGKSSFESSVASYDKKLWEIKDIGNYLIINSLAGNNMRVYMNKPMTTPGSDSSQDEMLRDIAAEGYEITSFIHRGHSYHLQQSLRKISPSAAFVFLGSCGGYSEVLNVFQLNPDVNIIVTRNIGSKLINDPMLQKINLDLVNNKDIIWDKTWAYLHTKFTGKQTKDLFSSYIAPNNYVGVKFIRKVLSY